MAAPGGGDPHVVQGLDDQTSGHHSPLGQGLVDQGAELEAPDLGVVETVADLPDLGVIPADHQ